MNNGLHVRVKTSNFAPIKAGYMRRIFWKRTA